MINQHYDNEYRHIRSECYGRFSFQAHLPVAIFDLQNASFSNQLWHGECFKFHIKFAYVFIFGQCMSTKCVAYHVLYGDAGLSISNNVNQLLSVYM